MDPWDRSNVPRNVADRARPATCRRVRCGDRCIPQARRTMKLSFVDPRFLAAPSVVACGLTFAEVGKVDDPITQPGLCCGTLYELPKAIGALSAGTLLWSASVGGDAPNAPMTIPVWKSTDDGRTWTFVSTVVTGGVPRKN